MLVRIWLWEVGGWLEEEIEKGVGELEVDVLF